MYVLVRGDGNYVAPPGQDKSYTDRLEDAWVFRYSEDAERNRCPESERVVALTTLLRHLS